MTQQGPLPYLVVGGVEVANAARTMAYMRNGLADSMQGHWELGTGDLCGVLYRDESSGCVPTEFVSPASDPAPWYDADEPGSTDFLGIVLLGLHGYDSTLTRTVTNRIGGLGGGVASGQQRVPRQWKFRGALISSSDAGAEYGLRWLIATLQASSCATCDTTDLTVRLVCPPEDCTDEGLGKWMSYEVALTAGPSEVQQFSPGQQDDTLGGCRDFVIEEWTMTAANPFLYKDEEPTGITDETLSNAGIECTDICDFLFGTGEPICAEVIPPRWKGQTIGSIFTLVTGSGGMGPFEIASYDTCEDDGVKFASMRFSDVPADSTLVINSAQHSISLISTDPVTGQEVITDGLYLVTLNPDESLQWIEVSDCDNIGCFCIYTVGQCGTGESAQVTLTTQLREG